MVNIVIALKNLNRHPPRTAFSIIVIGIAASIPISILSLSSEVKFLIGNVFGTISYSTIFIAVLFSLQIIYTVATINWIERMGELAMLRAVGWSRFKAASLFITESLWLAFFGSIIAVLLSIVAIYIVPHTNFAPVSLTFNLDPGIFVRAIIFLLLTGLLGSLYPAIKVSRLSPADTLNGLYSSAITGGQVIEP